ncbi:hypothetical protein R3P38DRAFT_2761349 [Favolaschia claudopus]|uniref:C2H2-type domain-containing protein n=1 Tax=Favolaschia claudopus TaxID=2862362 RepID=A0AAW0DNI2_9AGAR
MFPEHLIPPRRPASETPRPDTISTASHSHSHSHWQRNQGLPAARHDPPIRAPPVNAGYSFNVLKSDPRGSSLEHLASSAASSPRWTITRTNSYPTNAIHHAPTSPTSSEREVEVGSNYDGDELDDGEWSSMEEGGKKHVCPTCSKRFNRPSSLRIHINTHTGATPFRCPHPSCGRAFNVNSNMRRHYRNHGTSNNNSPSSPTSFDSSSPISPGSSSPSSATWSHSSSPSTSTSTSTSSSSPLASPVTSSSSSAGYIQSPTTTSFYHRQHRRNGVASESWTLAPVSTWDLEKRGDAPNHHYSYSESHVRSERRS